MEESGEVQWGERGKWFNEANLFPIPLDRSGAVCDSWLQQVAEGMGAGMHRLPFSKLFG